MANPKSGLYYSVFIWNFFYSFDIPPKMSACTPGWRPKCIIYLLVYLRSKQIFCTLKRERACMCAIAVNTQPNVNKMSRNTSTSLYFFMSWCVFKHRESLDIFHRLGQHDASQHRHLIIRCIHKCKGTVPTHQNFTDANWRGPRQQTASTSTFACHPQVQKLPSSRAEARSTGIGTQNCVVEMITVIKSIPN
jgi:hypothetical protein